MSFTDLSFARSPFADLSGADLSFADLDDSDLRNANLSGAKLSNIKLSITALDGALYDNFTIFPTGYDAVAADMTFLDNSVVPVLLARESKKTESSVSKFPVIDQAMKVFEVPVNKIPEQNPR